jgi:hypothetical protein
VGGGSTASHVAYEHAKVAPPLMCLLPHQVAAVIEAAEENKDWVSRGVGQLQLQL